MEFRPASAAPSLTRDEVKTLERLVESSVLSDVRQVLESMVEAGTKGNFEQESVPIARVLQEVNLGRHVPQSGDMGVLRCLQPTLSLQV